MSSFNNKKCLTKSSYYDSMHSDHIWFCLKKNASFLVKQKKGKPTILSREPLNILNKHTHTYSGLLNDKALGVESCKDNKGVVLLIKNTSENCRNKPSRLVNRIYFSQRRSLFFVAQHIRRFIAKKHYRADLQEIAITRARLFLSSPTNKKSFPERRRRKKDNIASEL
ncbi:hypothetical protein PORY_002656 [Pneumocystis oryctolagi]|uniref:Uncharacterized protein n=1 Tax=Pneumocystis oryctolagi TaxID=42067 RepID=A0ACB7CBQ7_9ASCO|nr:hypothetical protein PORY_002656 [Pneumocystis oryctolagi]